MAVSSLKLLGGGQPEVQQGTLLMMMKGHISLKRKRVPARKKGTFFHDYWGGALGTALSQSEQYLRILTRTEWTKIDLQKVADEFMKHNERIDGIISGYEPI